MFVGVPHLTVRHKKIVKICTSELDPEDDESSGPEGPIELSRLSSANILGTQDV
jgi:hypothetical protein